MKIKIFLIFLMAIFLANNVLAFDWDNVIAETGTDPNTGYPTMEVSNCNIWVGIPTLFGTCLNKGETLFEGAVTEHTKQCGTECESKIEINHSGGVLIDDIRFLTEQNDGSWIKQPVRNYKFKYEAELPEYETQCIDLPEVYVEGNITNGTQRYYYTPQSCEQVQVGTYTGFKTYNVGESLPSGNYEMFLEAKKKPSRTVDWQIKIEGRWMKEWAVWGDIINYYQEDANNTEVVGATWDVTYSANKGYDGDFGTYALASNFAPYLNLTYIKPNGADSATWKVKDNDGTFNLTIPSDCWDYDSNKLELQAKSEQVVSTQWSCYNGTWKNLRTSSTSWRIYEEGIYWNSSATAQVTLNSPTDNYISDTDSITFNATANVTNGAYLTNMSLWTNFTGTWALNETTITYEPLLENYYKFDEGSGTNAIDYLENLNGTLSGVTYSTTQKREGYSITGFSDDVGEYIRFNQEITPNTEWTIGFWVYPTDMGHSNNADFGGGNQTIWRFYENYDGGGGNPSRITFGNGASTISSSTYPITENSWKHIVITYNSTDYAHIYVNNNSVAEGQMSPLIATSYWQLGDAGNFETVDGYYDEAYFFNKELTQEEVTEIYNEGTHLNITDTETGAEAKTSSTQTWTKTISDTTIWNVEACDTDGDCGFSTANFTVSLDATAPTISITSPTTPIETHVIGDTLYLNTTITDTNLEACWYEYNGVNTTITGCQSGVLNSTGFSTVSGQQSITVYANDSVSNLASEEVSWTYNFIENDATYTAYAYETQSDTFELNFTTQISVQSISAELKHNGDSYTSTATCDGSNCLLTNTIDLPLVSTGTSENKTFYWEFTIFDGASSNTYNSTSREQNISRIYFQSCGGGVTTEALDFTAAREDNLTAINPFYFGGSFDYWLGSGTVMRSYNYEEASAANVDLCISPVTETYYIDGQVNYDGTDSTYIERTYLFDNYSINNVSQGIALLLIEATDSTTFIQEVLENKEGVEGAIIYTYRYYTGDNSWNITQITQTDSDGKTVGFYEAETATYKHEITLDGVTVINETSGRKMIPETVPYTITWQLDEAISAPWEDWDDELGISKSLTWNEDTEIVTYTYTGNSSFSNGNLTVYKENYAEDDELICNSSNVLSVATITCNMSGEDGNFIARAYVDRGSETLFVDSIRFSSGTGKDTFGKGGVLLAWFIILVAGCAFLVHPIIGIVAVNISIILVNMIGLVTFGWLFVFGILAVSGVLIWLMKD